MTRLGIVIALMAEAVPLIDYYRLQKQAKRPHYHHFSSDDITLVVCGMGAKTMATGFSAYLADERHALPERWLNFGIAGTQLLEVGTLVWGASIGGVKIGIPESAVNQQAMDVISVSKPSTQYKTNSLLEMEAGAYLNCIVEKVAECQINVVFCAKVVSDNACHKPHKINKGWVTDLVRGNLDTLNLEILKLIKS